MQDERVGSLNVGTREQLLSLLERQNRLIDQQNREVVLLRLKVDTLTWALAGASSRRPSRLPVSVAAPIVTLLVPPAAIVPSGVPSVVKKRVWIPSHDKRCAVCRELFSPVGPRQKVCKRSGCLSALATSPRHRAKLIRDAGNDNR